jgi:uncharacterized protein YdbL (DUF1318 family)
MDAKTQAIVATLAAQRNQALDTVAQQNGLIAELTAALAELTTAKAKEGECQPV